MPSDPRVPNLPLAWGSYCGIGKDGESKQGYYGIVLEDKVLSNLERVWGSTQGSGPTDGSPTGESAAKASWDTCVEENLADCDDTDFKEWVQLLDPHTMRGLIEMAWKAREAGIA